MELTRREFIKKVSMAALAVPATFPLLSNLNHVPEINYDLARKHLWESQNISKRWMGTPEEWSRKWQLTARDNTLFASFVE